MNLSARQEGGSLCVTAFLTYYALRIIFALIFFFESA